MFRLFSATLVLLVLPLALRAQEKKATVIRLTVEPKAAPRPALKYQLLPELSELQPGNPVLGYLRCFAEQNHFFYSKEAVEEREKWAEMPLKDLPVKKLRGYGGQALLQADYAARLETPDWQVLGKLRKEGAFLLLPDIQQMRTLMRALEVRFRVELAERRYDAACTTAKTMFALSRHVGEHPTLIADLVGVALAQVSVQELEEMIQQPGSPNLYWALTDLPRPFIDLRKGVQGDRVMLAREAAVLDEHAPMTEGQLKKALERLRLVLLMGSPGGPHVKEVAQKFLARVNDPAHVQAARKRLVRAGLDDEKVKRFPALQVVLLDEKYAFEARRDDVAKSMSLPYWQAQAVHDRNPTGSKEVDASPVERLLLAMKKVRTAQVRLEQRIALLRCVEALRLYAAAHEGRLPAQLADVGVPVPVDPVTGKAFHYDLKGETAVVRGTPPRGLEEMPWFNVRYEVTIRKQ